MNFASQNNFNNNAYRGNFNPRTFPGNSSNNYGGSYGNPSYNNNRNTSDLENNIKEFINAQKNFNNTIEEKLNKIDDMSSSVDGICHDIENLKLNFLCLRLRNQLKPYMFIWMKERKEPLCLELKENF